jgi:YebC/PmpR family DNA-binding regulatory protein
MGNHQAQDAKRGKIFTKLIKELTVAARVGGSGDPNHNARLRKAIDDAKAQSMPADTIQRAVKRGTGELEGAAYEEVLYEGTGPGGTLFLVEGMTDNRNRTVAELRKIFEKHGGVLGSSGTAGWAFDKKGLIQLAKEAATEDLLMEAAVGAGADDYSDEGDEWQVTTPPEALQTILDALAAAKVSAKGSQLAFLPKNRKAVMGKEAEQCLGLVDALDDNDDVQNVFADFDISEEEMARLEGA